jgi:predicted transcriptional regulator
MKSRPISRRDTNKNLLLKCIKNSPGIRYRELMKATGFPNGVAQYHLKILEKSKRVKVSRHYGKTTRYYPLSTSAKESRIIEHIRHPTRRKIILFLLQHDPSLFADIKRNIRRVPSTVSWHLSRLKESGVISINHQTYRLKNRSLVIRLMKKFNT